MISFMLQGMVFARILLIFSIAIINPSLLFAPSSVAQSLVDSPVFSSIFLGGICRKINNKAFCPPISNTHLKLVSIDYSVREIYFQKSIFYYLNTAELSLQFPKLILFKVFHQAVRFDCSSIKQINHLKIVIPSCKEPSHTTAHTPDTLHIATESDSVVLTTISTVTTEENFITSSDTSFSPDTSSQASLHTTHSIDSYSTPYSDLVTTDSTSTKPFISTPISNPSSTRNDIKIYSEKHISNFPTLTTPDSHIDDTSGLDYSPSSTSPGIPSSNKPFEAITTTTTSSTHSVPDIPPYIPYLEIFIPLLVIIFLIGVLTVVIGIYRRRSEYYHIPLLFY